MPKTKHGNSSETFENPSSLGSIFFGETTLELITAATYQYQAKFQALPAATIF